jgi:hypothetical protein
MPLLALSLLWARERGRPRVEGKGTEAGGGPAGRWIVVQRICSRGREIQRTALVDCAKVAWTQDRAPKMSRAVPEAFFSWPESSGTWFVPHGALDSRLAAEGANCTKVICETRLGDAWNAG